MNSNCKIWCNIKVDTHKMSYLKIIKSSAEASVNFSIYYKWNQVPWIYEAILFCALKLFSDHFFNYVFAIVCF